MMTLIMYKKMTPRELRSEAKGLVGQLQGWFRKNPRRQNCLAGLWYGREHTFKRRDLKAQVKSVVDALVKDDDFMRRG
jgi:hypothetical protein